MKSFSLGLSCLVALAGCGRPAPLVVAMAGVDAGAAEPFDAGAPTIIYPTSMGDPFAVDAPVLLADNGVGETSVAFNGHMHLVAWSSPRGVLAMRYDRDGHRLDSTPILVSPPGMLRGDLKAVARPGDEGFDVFWAGPYFFGGSNVSAPGYGALYVSRVALDGSATLATQVSSWLSDTFSLFDLGTSEDTLNGAYHVFRVITVKPGGLRLDSFGVLGGIEPRLFRSFNDYGGVTVPTGEVLSEVAFTRLGQRDYVATITRDGPGATLELRALAPRDDYPSKTTDPGVVVFSTPIFTPPVDLTKRYASLETVGGRVVLVWKDKGPANMPVLRAVSVLPTGGDAFDVSDVTVLAQTDSFGRHEVATSVAGPSLLVGVRGIASKAWGQEPVAVALDPVTLAQRTSISAPGLTNEIHFRGCSFDGEQCLLLLGLGDLWTFSLAQRVPLDGALQPVNVEQALLGQVNGQSAPRAACTSRTCLLLWADGRTGSGNGGEQRMIRVDPKTGVPVDADSASAFGNVPSDSTSVAGLATRSTGFVVAQGRCSTPGSTNSTMQLWVRVVPEAGEPGAAQVVDFPQYSCRAWGPLVVAANESHVLVAAVQRDAPSPGDPSPLLLASLGADGVAQARPHTITLGRHGYGALDAVLVGDRATLALKAGDFWSTAVLDLAGSTPDRMGLDFECPDDHCSAGERRLVSVPGNPHVGWVELAKPSYLLGGPPDWALRWAELDESGRPLANMRTLTQSAGEAYGLEVTADERGLAVLVGQRTFASDDYTLAFRRFGAVPQPQDPRLARVVATGIHTPGHAVASVGNGQWLTAYAESGATNGALVFIGGDASRVFGRFVYEAAPEAQVQSP